MSSMLYLVARITRKMGINKYVFNILKVCVGRDQEHLAMDGWMHSLSQISPDKGVSCIRQIPFLRRGARVDLDIIIPVYNTEKYVAECIESALNQKSRYLFRVIIIDDGSTDASPDIINSYVNDSRVHIIHQENRGFSGARNRALEQIEGRYVTFLDSDDRLPVDSIEKLLSKAYEGDFDIVGGGYVRFEGKRYRSKAIPHVDLLYGLVCGKVYKAQIWEKIKFPENYWFEDTINALIVHDSAKKITSIQNIVYEYRINRKSISFRSIGNPRVIDSLWVTLRLVKDRETLGLPLDNKFLDQLVNQCKVNMIRIASLGNRQANKANFYASVELYNRYCKNYRCRKSANTQLEDAILHNDYWQFLLGCLFL